MCPDACSYECGGLAASVIGLTYWLRGEPVVVLARWSGKVCPRNVLIRDAGGRLVVRPFRGLRKRPPAVSAVRTCGTCGTELVRREKDSHDQWAERRFCSRNCAAKRVRVPRCDSPPQQFLLYAVGSSTDACIEWPFSRAPNGYGKSCYQSKDAHAHRIVFQMLNGPITSEEYVLHRCDNRPCVNPRHLFKGDHAANMRDMVSKGRHVTKLKPEGVRQIRHLAAQGTSDKELAARFGVHPDTIRSVLVGKTWGYVT